MSQPRRELKYQLDPLRYRAVRGALVPFMRLDAYSRRAPQRRYFVRSLYYDSPDCAAYVEKVAGEARRLKLRLRTYFERPEACEFVSVELKCRFGNLVLKHSVHADRDAYEAYRATGSWAAFSHPVTDEAERLCRRFELRPTVLVDYRREALAPREPSPLRITFDHQVESASARELYPPAARFRAWGPRFVVMEVKSPTAIPPWLQALIRAQGLESGPNSKYTQGIEASHPGLLPTPLL